MNYLGIDPGNEQSAYCVIDDKQNIIKFGKVDNEEMLKLICFITLSDRYKIAIEKICNYGFRVGQSVFDTCFWSGRFFENAIDSKPVMVGRKAVITALTNNPNGNDKLIRETMISRYGKQGNAKNKGKTYGISKDVWSALAIATWLKDKIEFDKFYEHSLGKLDNNKTE